MFRFGISEYIRNWWFNLCVILIMVVMMLISTIFISNIDEQTKIHRLASKYIDTDSIFVANVFDDFYKEISKEKNMLISQTFFGNQGDNTGTIRASVYSKEVMEGIKPRLDSGTYPSKVKKDNDTVVALISNNPYGIKAGDTFEYNISYKEDEKIKVNIYVAGVISDGQRLYTDLGHIDSNMTFEDFFQIYSYEQEEEVRLIIPEEEIKKIKNIETASAFYNIIINPDDTMSAEDKRNLKDKISNYEKEVLQSIPSDSLYPDAEDIVYRSNEKYKGTLLKYVPLTVIVLVLFLISITGIVTIKTVRSIRYFGIMYICGMNYTKAQFMTILEMTFNSVLAFAFTTNLLALQKQFKLVGKINCNIGMLQMLFMLSVCIIIVLWSGQTTKNVLKGNTPIEIIKNME